MCIYTLEKQKFRKIKNFLLGECATPSTEKLIFFKNIFENNFYMVTRELPMEKDTIFYLFVTWHVSIFVSFCGILCAGDA